MVLIASLSKLVGFHFQRIDISWISLGSSTNRNYDRKTGSGPDQVQHFHILQCRK